MDSSSLKEDEKSILNDILLDSDVEDGVPFSNESGYNVLVAEDMHHKKSDTPLPTLHSQSNYNTSQQPVEPISTQVNDQKMQADNSYRNSSPFTFDSPLSSKTKDSPSLNFLDQSIDDMDKFIDDALNDNIYQKGNVNVTKSSSHFEFGTPNVKESSTSRLLPTDNTPYAIKTDQSSDSSSPLTTIPKVLSFADQSPPDNNTHIIAPQNPEASAPTPIHGLEYLENQNKSSSDTSMANTPSQSNRCQSKPIPESTHKRRSIPVSNFTNHSFSLLDMSLEDMPDISMVSSFVETPYNVDSLNRQDIKHPQPQPNTELHKKEDDEVTLSKEQLLSDDENATLPLETETKKDVMNRIVVVKLLEKMTKRLKSKQFAEKEGMPTCIDVSSLYIAVGTSRGKVFVFDHFQEIMFIVGDETTETYGRVYSVALSDDCEWVIVGYHSGDVCIWNITSQKKIKSFKHDSPVIYISFLDEKKSKFICCCLNSVVLMYSLSKVLGMYLSDVLIVMGKTVERGPILTVSALKPDSMSLHPINQVSLMACGSYSHIMILSVQETSHLMYQLKRPKTITAECLPYFSWRPLQSKEMEDGKYKLFDPILAIAWGNNINLVLITSSKNADSKLNFKVIAAHKSHENIIGISWIDPSAIVFLTKSNELILFDPFKSEEIETCSKYEMTLASHGQFSLLKSDGILSYHNSLCCFKEHVYTLGLPSIYTTHLRSWEERIDKLIEKHHFIEAIGLLIEFIEGKSTAGVKLPRNKLKANSLLHLKMEKVLITYATTSLKMGTLETSFSHDSVANICIDCCFNIGRSDFIFQGLYPIFKQYNQEGLIFETIIPFIIGGKVSKLKPEIIQHILKYYEEANPGMIEELIPHLDISQIDFHIVVKICIRNILSDTLYSVYIRALKDYISPLEILIDIFTEETLTNQTEFYLTKKKALGYQLIEYMTRMFQGKSVIDGDYLSRDKTVELREAILKGLLSGGVKPLSRLVCFLKYDCKVFLSSISIAFEQMGGTSLTLQHWINTLVFIIMDHPEKSLNFNKTLDKEDASLILVFVLRYILSYDITTALKFDHIELIKALDPYPTQQYEFFNAFLESGRAKGYVLPPNLGEKMLDLMCQFEPFKVYPWIQKYDASYILDHAIEITSRYEATIGTYCKLLEKVGDLGKSLDAILALTIKKVSTLPDCIPNIELTDIDQFEAVSFPKSKLNNVISEIKKLLSYAFSLCQKNANKTSESERKDMWMKILQTMMQPAYLIESRFSDFEITFEIPQILNNFALNLTQSQLHILRTFFHQIIGFVVDNALGSVSPNLILDKITKEGNTPLRDFKTIFNLLIEDFKYEETMLNEVNLILKEDAFKSMNHLMKMKRQRVPPRKVNFE